MGPTRNVSSAAGVIAFTTAATLLAAGVSVPAEAAPVPTRQVVTKNCVKSVAGIPLRVKMRFDRVLRVRVTHPEGTGNLRDARVARVSAFMSYESAPVPPDEDGNEIGGAAWGEPLGDRPVYRIRGWGDAVTTATVTFTLTNGKEAKVACTQRFS